NLLHGLSAHPGAENLAIADEEAAASASLPSPGLSLCTEKSNLLQLLGGGRLGSVNQPGDMKNLYRLKEVNCLTLYRETGSLGSFCATGCPGTPAAFFFGGAEVGWVDSVSINRLSRTPLPLSFQELEMVAPTWNDDWPQEVNIAVAGFTAALEIMKGIRLETNIALKNKNNARQGGEIILGLASSGLTPGGFSGSDASVAANLAANVSSATKAYTASLGKLKVGKAAARQARSQAEEKLAAHKINDFNLPSLDAALKSVQPKTIRRSNIERPAPHAASPVAVSSPLSSIPPSPGCSDGQVGYAIAPLPSNLQQGVVCPPTPPWAHPECPDPITGFPGQSHPKDSPTLPMALPEGTGSPAPADTTPTIPIGNCSGESPFQAPAQPLAEAPMDVDYPNSSGRSRTPSVSKLSEVDTLHAPMPIDSEQPCSADTEVATSVTTELSSPAAPEHASSSGAGFPAYVFAPPKVEPATHPASSWLQHMESMAAPGFPFLPNQFGMNPLHFSNGNSSFHPAFKNGVYGAGSMPFPASLHGPSTTPGGSSWTSAELSTKPHLPIYDLSGFPHFFPYSMHPADLPGPSLADHQLGIPPAE
ncbi:hypothetical protein AGABI1DRAFT_95911, partial [Agaricus bisporus var. burnettii JB137-S8]